MKVEGGTVSTEVDVNKGFVGGCNGGVMAGQKKLGVVGYARLWGWKKDERRRPSNHWSRGKVERPLGEGWSGWSKGGPRELKDR